MSDQVGVDIQYDLAFLDSDLSALTERAAYAARGPQFAYSLGVDPLFVRLAPPLYLVKLLQGWPEAFMGGAVFSRSYDSLGPDMSGRLNLARVAGHLNDLALLSTPDTSWNEVELARFDLGLQLLRRELAPRIL